MKKPYRRRNYFTKKGFQSRFILRFLVASSAGSILAVGLFNLLAYKKVDAVLFSMRIPEASTGALLFREALFSNIAAITTVIVVLVLTARGLFRKISGPLSTVRAELRKLAGGHLSARIILRPDDEFKGFADNINRMADDLDKRFLAIKSHVHHISKSLRDLQRTPDDGEKKVLSKGIMEHAEGLEKKIGEFKR